jgi:formylglycine-generating enzyme required for sulfatase activity
MTALGLVLIQPGTFTMGSPPSTPGREAQEVQHRVTITRPFYLGWTEVTQYEWTLVMGSNPSHFTSCGPSCPVEGVTFADVEAFIARLNQRGGPKYRLPTEAEWEYACRAGDDAPFGGRDSLASTDANIDGRFPYNATASGESAGTMPVGRFAANAWGLVDMAGNVWEWTADWYAPGFAPEPQVSPTGPGMLQAAAASPDRLPRRVIKGGSWLCAPNFFARYRPAARQPMDADLGASHIGFRTVAR